MLTSASAAPPSSWFDAFHAQPCFIEHSVLSSEGQVPAHIYFQIPEGMSRRIQQLLLEIKMAAMVSCAEAHGLQGSTSPKAPLPISLRASKSSEDIRCRCNRTKSLSCCSKVSLSCLFSSSDSLVDCSLVSRLSFLHVQIKRWHCQMPLNTVGRLI